MRSCCSLSVRLVISRLPCLHPRPPCLCRSHALGLQSGISRVGVCFGIALLYGIACTQPMDRSFDAWHASSGDMTKHLKNVVHSRPYTLNPNPWNTTPVGSNLRDLPLWVNPGDPNFHTKPNEGFPSKTSQQQTCRGRRLLIRPGHNHHVHR